MKEPIITSLLDLDLYKLTQGNFIRMHFPNVLAEYRMNVRNGVAIEYNKYVPREEFMEELNSLDSLRLTEEEKKYLHSLCLFHPSYIDFLTSGVFNAKRYIHWPENEPYPTVVGNWMNVMLYETLFLSIGNEIYARNWMKKNHFDYKFICPIAFEGLKAKTDLLRDFNLKGNDVKIIEFGTRRRFSKEFQRLAILRLDTLGLLAGTSNVKYARNFGIKSVGSQAHELFMGYQSLFPVHESQKAFLCDWLRFYGGKFSIALSDTYGTKKFLKDFSRTLAGNYDGVRHDSGCPYKWGSEIIEMYHRYGIDPKTKTLLFSDGLDIPKVISLYRHFHYETNVAFGVGTNITNDTFIPVPQAVMKLSECNGMPVAKLSNNPDKATCKSAQHLDYVKYVAENL